MLVDNLVYILVYIRQKRKPTPHSIAPGSTAAAPFVIVQHPIWMVVDNDDVGGRGQRFAQCVKICLSKGRKQKHVLFLSSNVGNSQTSNIKYYIIRPCTYQLLAVNLPVQPVVHSKHPPVVGQLQRKVTFLLRQESATQIFPSQYVPHVARQAIEPIVVPRHHVTQRCVRWERGQRFLFIPHRRGLFGGKRTKDKTKGESRECSTKTDFIFSAT